MDHRHDPDDHVTAWLRGPSERAGQDGAPQEGAERDLTGPAAAGATTTGPAGAGRAEGVVPGPPDLGGSWNDDEPAPRRRRLWLLALVPWVAAGALALLLLGGDGAPEDPEAAEAAGAAEAAPPGDASVDEPAPTADEVSPAAPPGTDARGSADAAAEATAEADAGAGDARGPEGAPVEAGGADASALRASALAEAAVRGAPHETGAEETAWIDHARVEHREPIDRARWLVTVVAGRLTGDGERWERQETVRYGVLVDVDAGHVVDQPWPLPAPQPPVDPDALVATDDADLLVAGALEEAGYAEVSVDTVQHEAERARWLRARVQARGPGAREASPHTVWVDGIHGALLGHASAAAPAVPSGTTDGADRATDPPTGPAAEPGDAEPEAGQAEERPPQGALPDRADEDEEHDR